MNVVNQVAYLRTSRDFPRDDVDRLSIELQKSYIDTALAVNSRTIGIFPTNKPSINGESWYITSARQEGLRQIYAITSTTTIPHGLIINNIERFVRFFGAYSDGTNWYAFVPGSTTAIPGQIGFYVTSTSIVFTVGAGAPALTFGTVVLEWISEP